MIYSIRGRLTHTAPNLAVVECGGVGYACKTTHTTLAGLPKLGGEALLYTHLQVSESDISLFGFASGAELDCFRMITSVTGVGPKVALAILSDLTPDRLALAVAAGDYKAFTRTPGVGNKIAQRLVLELKDKVSSGDIGGMAPDAGGAEEGAGAVAEAIGALSALGYSRSEAVVAVGKLDQSLPVEELIKAGLKVLSAGAQRPGGRTKR